MKVSSKLYLATTIQFFVAILLIFSVLYVQEKQNKDSVIINLAGRQRMLTQKMTKELLLFSQNQGAPDDIRKTMGVFEMTLKALAYGGKAPLDLELSKFAILPAPKGSEILKQLKKVELLWQEYKRHAAEYLESKNQAALDYIKAHNLQILKEMNKAVFLMDQNASTKVVFLRKCLISGIIVIFLIFCLSFYIVRKNVHSIFELLGKLIQGLSGVSEGILNAASVISSSSQVLAEGSSSQAAALEETSSSLEEMSSMTKQSAENAGQANRLMQETEGIVNRATEAMEGLTGCMDEISEASEDIGNIISAIDEIAFQTNLLALNAAVEAARAGEAGAGFAVVADEVRNLAMRSADAAKNTAALIERTVEKISEGSGLVSQTNNAFGEVNQSTSKVGQLVADIAAASEEQAEGIAQISQAVSDLDHVTQKNAGNATETAETAEKLKQHAEQLQNIVNEVAFLIGSNRQKDANQ